MAVASSLVRTSPSFRSMLGRVRFEHDTYVSMLLLECLNRPKSKSRIAVIEYISNIGELTLNKNMRYPSFRWLFAAFENCLAADLLTILTTTAKVNSPPSISLENSLSSMWRRLHQTSYS